MVDKGIKKKINYNPPASATRLGSNPTTKTNRKAKKSK